VVGRLQRNPASENGFSCSPEVDMRCSKPVKYKMFGSSQANTICRRPSCESNVNATKTIVKSQSLRMSDYLRMNKRKVKIVNREGDGNGDV
jgi:hypothetical protein